jgi:hypothetical protein
MNIVSALQDPTSALKLFKRYSVEANDGVINSPRAAIAGLQQVKDMPTGPENAAIHSSMVHDQDRIAFIELRKSTTVAQKNDAMSDLYQRFLDTGRDPGKKKKYESAFQNESQILQAEYAATFTNNGEDVLKTIFHRDYVAQSTPMYFLPWDPAGGSVQMTIPNRALGTPYQKHPMIFLTAMLSGCSVFVGGSAQNPTIYHCGTSSKTPQDRSAKSFWNDAMRQLGVDPGNTSAVHNVDYIKASHHDTGAHDRKTLAAKQRLNTHYGQHGKQALEVESVLGWGAVFGIRTGLDWEFYLQENAVVVYHKIQADDAGTGVVPVSPSRKVSRPLLCRKIFPGNGNAHVKILSRWRTLRF